MSAARLEVNLRDLPGAAGREARRANSARILELGQHERPPAVEVHLGTAP